MSIPPRKTIKDDLIALLDKHGPMSTTKVYSSLADRWLLTGDDITSTRSGGALYQNEIRWARQELALEGVITRPSEGKRGVWKLKNGLIPASEGQVEEVEFKPNYPEGAVKKVLVNGYERSLKARSACLAHHGHSCLVCGFNFESVFGAIGKGRIHVHHKIEISAVGAAYQVDPIAHLVPICPNCHFMAHQRRPAFSVEELKAMLKSTSKEAG